MHQLSGIADAEVKRVSAEIQVLFSVLAELDEELVEAAIREMGEEDDADN